MRELFEVIDTVVSPEGRAGSKAYADDLCSTAFESLGAALLSHESTSRKRELCSKSVTAATEILLDFCHACHLASRSMSVDCSATRRKI